MIKRGEIIDVNLDPTLGSETGKVRPCVVVTNDIYNARVPIIQVVPITTWSNKKSKIKTNVVIESSKINGLAKRSIADCLQTRPIDKRIRYIKTRGNLESDRQAEIDECLKIVFELI